jgi:hypothetical protein
LISILIKKVVHREDSYGAETLSLPEGTPEGQYLVTIELLPFEKPDLKEKEEEKEKEKEVEKEGDKKEQKVDKKETGSVVKPRSDSLPVNERQKGDEETRKGNGDNEKGSSKEKEKEKVKVREDESKTEGTDLEEMKNDDDTLTTPTPAPTLPLVPQTQEPKQCVSFESNHSNTYGTSTASREDPPQRFGIIKGEGSVWVEWLVNSSRGGSVSVGAMTAAAAEDPDARYVTL